MNSNGNVAAVFLQHKTISEKNLHKQGKHKFMLFRARSFVGPQKDPAVAAAYVVVADAFRRR